MAPRAVPIRWTCAACRGCCLVSIASGRACVAPGLPHVHLVARRARRAIQLSDVRVCPVGTRFTHPRIGVDRVFKHSGNANRARHLQAFLVGHHAVPAAGAIGLRISGREPIRRARGALCRVGLACVGPFRAARTLGRPLRCAVKSRKAHGTRFALVQIRPRRAHRFDAVAFGFRTGFRIARFTLFVALGRSAVIRAVRCPVLPLARHGSCEAEVARFALSVSRSGAPDDVGIKSGCAICACHGTVRWCVHSHGARVARGTLSVSHE